MPDRIGIRNYYVNTDMIASALPGFKPTWNSRMGAQELFKANERVGWLSEGFEGPTYWRMYQFKQLIKDGRLDTKLRWRQSIAV